MTKYILMVLAGASSYGMLSTFVKLANREGYGAAEISLSQAFIGMIVLWIVVLLSSKTTTIHHQPSKWRAFILTGATIGITTFLYYMSVQYIPASIAAVILMQFAWMGVLLDWILFKRRPALIQTVAIVLIIGGTVMASGSLDAFNTQLSLTGVLYALGSAVLYAIYIVANGSIASPMPALKKSALIMTGSTLGILLLNVPTLTTTSKLDVPLLKWAVLLAVFGTIIPPVLFAAGIPKVGPGISSLIMTVELPVAILFAHLLLDEKLDLIQIIGVAIMLLALIILQLRKIKRIDSI